MVQCPQARELVGRTRDLERPGQRAIRDGVGRAVRVLRVRGELLVALVENNVVALVDSGTVDVEFAQGADYHLGMLVPREVAARARDTPIEVALVVEDGAASGATAHQVDSANAWRFRLHVLGGVVARCVQNAQIDLRPRVLVAANDYTWPVHVHEQDCAVWRRLPQYVILNGKVQVRVVAGGDVALQLVLRVRQRVRERGKVPDAANTNAWRG